MRLVSFFFPHIHTHAPLRLRARLSSLRSQKEDTHSLGSSSDLGTLEKKSWKTHTRSLVSALRSRRYQHKASLIATESHDKSSSDKCSGGIDFSHEDYHLCFWERKWEFDTFWWVLPVQEVALPSAPLIVSFEYCMVLHRDVLVKSSHLCVCVCGG